MNGVMKWTVLYCKGVERSMESVMWREERTLRGKWWWVEEREESISSCKSYLIHDTIRFGVIFVKIIPCKQNFLYMNCCARERERVAKRWKDRMKVLMMERGKVESVGWKRSRFLRNWCECVHWISSSSLSRKLMVKRKKKKIEWKEGNRIVQWIHILDPSSSFSSSFSPVKWKSDREEGSKEREHFERFYFFLLLYFFLKICVSLSLQKNLYLFKSKLPLSITLLENCKNPSLYIFTPIRFPWCITSILHLLQATRCRQIILFELSLSLAFHLLPHLSPLKTKAMFSLWKSSSYTHRFSIVCTGIAVLFLPYLMFKWDWNILEGDEDYDDKDEY